MQKKRIQLTENFHLDEFFKSKKHPRLAASLYKNVRPWQITLLYLLCKNILQPARSFFGVEFITNSGYRDHILNKNTPGASKNSLHKRCIAVDFTIKPESDGNKNLLENIYHYLCTELDDMCGEIILYKNIAGEYSSIHVSMRVHDKEPFRIIKINK